MCLNFIWCKSFLDGSEEEEGGGRRLGGGGDWEGPIYLTIPFSINTHNIYTMMKKFAMAFQENTHICLNIWPCPILILISFPDLSGLKLLFRGV